MSRLQCYACGEARQDRLKHCSHCERWSCGEHAEQHIYMTAGRTVGEEVICHACERAGQELTVPVEKALAVFHSVIDQERRSQKTQAQKKKKQVRKQQVLARKKNR